MVLIIILNPSTFSIKVASARSGSVIFLPSASTNHSSFPSLALLSNAWSTMSVLGTFKTCLPFIWPLVIPNIFASSLSLIWSIISTKPFSNPSVLLATDSCNILSTSFESFNSGLIFLARLTNLSAVSFDISPLYFL